MARVPVDDFVVMNIGGYLQVLPNTPIQVNIRGGAGATLYSDAAGTPKPNPFNSDADGHFSFWVDEGSYTIVASPAAGGTITLEWEAAKGAAGTGSGWPGTYPAVAADISDGAVGTTELADLSVTSGKIVDGSVIGTKLGAAAVGTVNMADLSISTAKIQDNAIVNAKIAAGAAIAWTKISKTGSSLADLTTKSAADLTSGILDSARLAAVPYSALALAGGIVDADVSATAALSWGKVSKAGSSLADLVTRSAGALNSGTLPNARLVAVPYTALSLTGSIVNADVSATADIGYTKLNLTGSVTNADISATAAIPYSKLSLSGSIVNADVSAVAAIAYSKLTLTGSIVNADIAGAAAISWTKVSKTGSSLADLTTRSAADLTSGVIPTARLPVFVGSGASHAVGVVPDAGATAGAYRFLREDGTWDVDSVQGIDIRKYGAVSGAANNTTAINAAFAAATAGQTVYFPFGVWNCTGDIIPKDGVHWKGEGTSRDISAGSVVNGRVNWGATDFHGHCDIEGIHFTNTTANNPGQCWLWQAQMSHITTKDCAFIGATSGTANMIHLDKGWVVGAFTCEPIRFHDCYFRNGNSAFYYKARNNGEFSKFCFENCRFDNFRGTALVIDTGYLKSGTLHNLTFEGFGNAGCTSIKIYAQFYGLTMSDIYTEGTCSVTTGLTDVDIRWSLTQTSPGDGSGSDVLLTPALGGSWQGGMLLDGTTLPSSATRALRIESCWPGFIVEGVSVNQTIGTFSTSLGQNVSARGCSFASGSSGYISTSTKAGPPVDADYTAVGSGALAVDTANSRLYVRVGSTWKSAALV